MGKCPHCGSKNIRKRYREHRRYKWRCRHCNGIFHAPKRGVAVWLIAAVVIAAGAAAAYFAAQQGLIALPSMAVQIDDKVYSVGETVSGTTPPATIQIAAPTATRAPIHTNSPTEQVETFDTPTPMMPIVAPIYIPPITATPTLVPSPTITSIPTSIPEPPHLRYLEEKKYMLELINAERKKAGVPPVVPGDNIAAQLHAESALANCFSSHWGIDGLKPYMRYSLAGGYQSSAENGSGIDYCIKDSDRYRPIRNITEEVDDAIDGWMASAGHRMNILDKHHKKVNIGLEWDKYNFFAFQHFEGDYVEYDELPSINDGGILSLSGTTKNGVTFRGERDLGVQIYYDPPPHELTRGQVSRTYCYGSGRPVASLREPLTGNRFWTESEYSTIYNPCPDPYDIPVDAPAARSHDEAGVLWEQAYRASRNQRGQSITVPWITALMWNARGDAFSVKANIKEVLGGHGNGVYTIVVWGDIDGERVVISEYSIFYGITPPGTYTPR